MVGVFEYGVGATETFGVFSDEGGIVDSECVGLKEGTLPSVDGESVFLIGARVGALEAELIMKGAPETDGTLGGILIGLLDTFDMGLLLLLLLLLLLVGLAEDVGAEDSDG